MIQVRRAVSQDADALCDAHVAAWRSAYRGLFPDEYLDSDEFETARRNGWRQTRWLHNDTVMFAGLIDDDVLGFGHVGQSDGEDSSLGEVFGFYVHPQAWGSSLAPQLMQACHDQLAKMGFGSAVLWVLRDNPLRPPVLRKGRLATHRKRWCVGGAPDAWHPGPLFHACGRGGIRPHAVVVSCCGRALWSALHVRWVWCRPGSYRIL